MTSSSEQSATTPEPRYIEFGDIITTLQTELGPRLYAAYATEIENALNNCSLTAYEITGTQRAPQRAPNVVELYQLLLAAAQRKTPEKVNIQHATNDTVSGLLKLSDDWSTFATSVNDAADPLAPLARLLNNAYWKGVKDLKAEVSRTILAQFKLNT